MAVQRSRRPGQGTGPRQGRPGRPCLLTPTVETKIVEGVRSGLPIKYAAAHADVAADTVREWVARGRDPDEHDPRFAVFAGAMAQARAERTHRLVTAIEAAGHTPNLRTGLVDWRALAWLLERTEPADFGRRSRVEATVGANTERGVVDLAALVGEAADRLGAIERGEVDTNAD